MKTGIMTWFSYRNYGTALQVVALSKTIRKLNHAPEVIDYSPRFRIHTLADNSALAQLKRELWKPKKRVNQKWSRHFCDEKKDEAFASFLTKHLVFSPVSNELSDLSELNHKYDCFVCGSDQIWSPVNFDPHYFLDFVSDTRKMVAYAPSVGLPKISDDYTKREMAQQIARFQHLSVREEQGAELIEKLLHRRAKIVCDPTMLLSGDEWRKLCDVQINQPQTPYILVYMLGNNDVHWERIEQIARENQLAIKIIPVYENDLNRPGCVYSAVGPEEFVRLIDCATIVCTDSFHGMVFSLLLHSTFVPFERFRTDDPINQNSRVFNLLEKFRLRNKLINYDGDGTVDYGIDFAQVDQIAMMLRQDSLQYLSSALTKVETIGTALKEKHHINPELCCGCGACAAMCPVSAIQVECGSDGFFRAVVDEGKCTQCGKCMNFCPFEGHSPKKLVREATLYSYKSLDKKTLTQSSSGGFAYDISRMLLQQGYAVLGCTFDEQSKRAKHILIDSVDELPRLQGSKYMQSDFATTLNQIKGEKKKIAVIGTPCQIAGARRVLKKNDSVVYIDLICHGVPSYNLYRKYMDYLSVRYGLRRDKITTLFRYKNRGWRERYIYSTDFDKEVCLHQKECPYFRMFEAGDCYSECCYECRWRDSSEADLRIGDYWGPRFETDQTGVSMVMSMNQRGDDLLEKIRSYEYGKMNEHGVEDYLRYQQDRNFPKACFYEDLIDTLANESISLETIVKRFDSRRPEEILDVLHLPNRIVKKILGAENYEKLKRLAGK